MPGYVGSCSASILARRFNLVRAFPHPKCSGSFANASPVTVAGAASDSHRLPTHRTTGRLYGLFFVWSNKALAGLALPLILQGFEVGFAGTEGLPFRLAEDDDVHVVADLGAGLGMLAADPPFAGKG